MCICRCACMGVWASGRWYAIRQSARMHVYIFVHAQACEIIDCASTACLTKCTVMEGNIAYKMVEHVGSLHTPHPGSKRARSAAKVVVVCSDHSTGQVQGQQNANTTRFIDTTIASPPPLMMTVTPNVHGFRLPACGIMLSPSARQTYNMRIL